MNERVMEKFAGKGKTTIPSKAVKSNPFHKGVLLFLFALTFVLVTAVSAPTTAVAKQSVIVMAEDLPTAVAAIKSVGGTVTHELEIINAAGALVTEAQYGRLAQISHVRLQQDRPLDIATEVPYETVRDDFNLLGYNNNNGS